MLLICSDIWWIRDPKLNEKPVMQYFLSTDTRCVILMKLLARFRVFTVTVVVVAVASAAFLVVPAYEVMKVAK